VVEKVSKVLVIHGPNLNLLGSREPQVYGNVTLSEINRELEEAAAGLALHVDFFQSNYEGAIVEAIHEARHSHDCIIINAAAYTHYSIAIRDALSAVAIPAIEVHISNIYQREDFRRHSVISPVVAGQICGFGSNSYLLALEGAARLIAGSKNHEKKNS
jgi:3-dehydroquinate dehydratase-2